MLITLSVGNALGAENDTHDFSQTLSQLLNNNASISSINIPAQSYTVKEVIVTYNYTKSITNAVTVAVSIGDTDFGSKYIPGSTSPISFKTNPQTSVSGAITIAFTNNTGSGTGHGTLSVSNVRLVEGAAAAKYDVHWSIKGVVVEDENLSGKPTVPNDVADLVADETCNGKVFVGWTANPTNDGSRPSDLFTTQAGTAISAETTYEAVFADAEEGDPTWQKITALANNDVVIFVYESGNPAAPIKELSGVTTSGTTIGTAADVSTNVAASYPLTVEVTTSNNVTKYSFKNGSDYLSWSTGNSLTTSTTKNDASTWTISESDNGSFSFANVGTTSRILQYNSGSPRWACYGNSNQSTFQIYKQVASTTYSNYATTCCTPLAQINGSFFAIHLLSHKISFVYQLFFITSMFVSAIFQFPQMELYREPKYFDNLNNRVLFDLLLTR